MLWDKIAKYKDTENELYLLTAWEITPSKMRE